MKAKRQNQRPEPGAKDRSKVRPVSETSRHQTVRFVFQAPNAREVILAGSFDGWSPTGLPMVRLDDGVWAKELVLAPGTYEYLFIVDGIWTPDPAATSSVTNPYGGINSSVTVG